MPATRHCCYGTCKSDSRYAGKENMQGVWWIPFPKPHLDREKCERWVNACGRKGFTSANVTKWTYICSMHFVGGNGPSDLHQDPVPAIFSPKQVEKMSRKRKPPAPRLPLVSKQQKLDAAETLLSLTEVQNSENPNHYQEQEYQQLHSKKRDVAVQTDFNGVHTSMQTEPSVISMETQTYNPCSETVTTRIENNILRNQSTRLENKLEKTARMTFSCESVMEDEKKMFFYTGLYVSQFLHLFNALGSSVNSLTYWRGRKTARNKPSGKVCGRVTKLSAKNQLFLTLVRLRLGLLVQDLAYRFCVTKSTVSCIVSTWVQLLYHQLGALRKDMFPSRDVLCASAPACFKPFPHTRAIVDCFEVFVHMPRNFEEQGNMYSSYKHHPTFKVLVGIAPNGSIIFLSDAFEGSISDKDIVVKSEFLNHLQPGDLIIADRGFTIYDLLMEKRVDLNIPPFMQGRDRLTPQEEVKTKQIARVRIHVERAIERMRKFKILNRVLPLSMKATATQLVFVIGCLVNYQKPLVD